MSKKVDKSQFNILRRQLTILAQSMRQSTIPNNTSLLDPQSKKNDYLLFGNKIYRRKRIVFLTFGCSVGSCTMCPLPNEALAARRRHITPKDIISQFENSFKGDNINNYNLVTVYNNGNFFVDKEIFPEVRRYIYQRIQKSRVSMLMVESLPQFINDKKITEAKQYLGEKKLAVCIGLQSADNLIRELAINSTCTKKAFKNAVNILSKNGYFTLAFLMIKPPFLTESEAINDVVKSIEYLSSLGINNPILCATRVAPNTVVNLMFRKNIFNPPWLWSIIEILRKTLKVCPQSNPRVVTSELKTESNPDSICPQNCSKCNSYIIKALERFNTTKSLNLFETYQCDCYSSYQRFLIEENKRFGQLSLQQRVALFLQKRN
jgi:radical SAM enzyme (TIGR01210 family)